MFVDEIIAVWVAAGIDTKTIFWSPMASIPSGDGPYSQISETGGIAPMRTQNNVTTPAYQRPAAQCVAYAKTSALALTRARQMYDAVVGIRNATLSGTWYMDVTPDQEPFPFPVDSLGRARFVFNIRAIKRPS